MLFKGSAVALVKTFKREKNQKYDKIEQHV